MSGEALTSKELADLSAWIDGELSPTQAEYVKLRVQSDPQWAAAHRHLLRLGELLDAAVAPAAPADLPTRIVAAIDQDRQLDELLDRWAVREAPAGLAERIKADATLEPLLDAWRVPDAPAALPGRIVAAARRDVPAAKAPRPIRLLRWAAPLAAAAAVALAVAVWGPELLTPAAPRSPGNATVANNPAPQPAEAGPLEGVEARELAVLLGPVVVADADVIDNLDTLRAIEDLQR